MSTEHFFSHCKERLDKCLSRFGKEETKEFFLDLGLMLREKNGYYYPLSEQASMVQQLLITELSRLNVQIICDEKIHEISPCNKPVKGKAIEIMTDSGKKYFDACVIACGSKAAPKTGSDGSGYELAKELGHKLKPVLPSLVQLRCNDSFCKELAGIRTESSIHIMNGNEVLCHEFGELQLTDYGISGIPVFQLSGFVNRYLYHNKNADLIAQIDFVPQMSMEEWTSFVCSRIAKFQDTTVERLFCGILNQKLMNLFLKMTNLKPEIKVKNTDISSLHQVFSMCRSFVFHIQGSNGFEQAQVCTGGVDLAEVNDDLESIYAPNVYFAGEILDVDGRCGGYNLQWAWTSGYLAGKAAAGNS